MVIYSRFVTTRLDGSGGKLPGRVSWSAFSSLEEKWCLLREHCMRTGELVGAQVHEVFTYGGTKNKKKKNILWFDIDSNDWCSLDEWIVSERFPFPDRSYEIVPSSTGRIHLYVSVDRHVPRGAAHDELVDMVASTAPRQIAERFDCAASHDDDNWIYLPGCAIGQPTMPQDLLAGCVSEWVVPELRGSELEAFLRRKVARERVNQ